MGNPFAGLIITLMDMIEGIVSEFEAMLTEASKVEKKKKKT